MSVSKAERETVIIFNKAEPLASVYTYNGKLKRKLTGLCSSRPEEAHLIGNDGHGGLSFEVPKGWVKINAAPNLTDEQRQAKATAARARFGSKSKVTTA